MRTKRTSLSSCVGAHSFWSVRHQPHHEDLIPLKHPQGIYRTRFTGLETHGWNFWMTISTDQILHKGCVCGGGMLSVMWGFNYLNWPIAQYTYGMFCHLLHANTSKQLNWLQWKNWSGYFLPPQMTLASTKTAEQTCKTKKAMKTWMFFTPKCTQGLAQVNQ